MRRQTDRLWVRAHADLARLRPRERHALEIVAGSPGLTIGELRKALPARVDHLHHPSRLPRVLPVRSSTAASPRPGAPREWAASWTPWERSFRARPLAAERHPAGGTAAPACLAHLSSGQARPCPECSIPVKRGVSRRRLSLAHRTIRACAGGLHADARSLRAKRERPRRSRSSLSSFAFRAPALRWRTSSGLGAHARP